MGDSLCNLLRLFEQKESQHICLDVGRFKSAECLSGKDILLCKCLSSVQPQGSKERPGYIV